MTGNTKYTYLHSSTTRPELVWYLLNISRCKKEKKGGAVFCEPFSCLSYLKSQQTAWTEN